ncbi:MAG: FecR domain-containing protein [Spirochaetaceae bacterium]
MGTAKGKAARAAAAVGVVSLTLVMLVAVGGPLGAQDAEVTYLEGFPELKSGGGSRYELDFGDLVKPGDSVITGKRDYAELEQGSGNSIRVNESTVFTLKQVEREGRTQTVLSNAVGSVSYRFRRATGREPGVETAGVAAGVRGTELTVYAADDGSSLFAVQSGLVDVESAGETVSLSENEAVEIAPGEPPGETFEWLGRELDFSSWNEERLDAFLDDPVEGLRRIRRRMDYFADRLEETYAAYEESREKQLELREVISRLQETEDEETVQEFRREELTPVSEGTATLVLNYRYYALSALSMRRYVVGKLYMQMKTRHILESDDVEFRRFAEGHAEIVDDYESRIVPRLNDLDI